MKEKQAAILLLMIFSLVLVSGCTDKPLTQKPHGQEEKESGENNKQSKNIRTPLSLSAEEFQQSIGWLTNDTIIYITNSEETSRLYTYHLFTGKRKKLYESENTIVSVVISPTKEKVLIHTSPSEKKAVITIIDAKGTVMLSKQIVSSELLFEWNPYDDQQILISSFNEQWDFEVLVLDMKEENFLDTPIKEPFGYWLTEDELIFLDWDENEPSLFAPVKKQAVFAKKGKETSLANVCQISSFKNGLVAVSVPDGTKEEVLYSFYTNRLKPKKSFKSPQLTRYQDWLIPYFDYNQAHNQFITFLPVTSGEADIYKDGFELAAFDINSGKMIKLLKGMDNEPIRVSPNGKYCLYGYQLENIIDLQTKKIISMVDS